MFAIFGVYSTETEQYFTDWQCLKDPYLVISLPFYIASSVNGQDELNPALLLATRAGIGNYLAGLGLPAVSRKQIVLFSHIINSLLASSVRLFKVAGCWLCSFFACLRTSTPSWSINAQSISSHVDLTPGQ